MYIDTALFHEELKLRTRRNRGLLQIGNKNDESLLDEGVKSQLESDEDEQNWEEDEEDVYDNDQSLSKSLENEENFELAKSEPTSTTITTTTVMADKRPNKKLKNKGTRNKSKSRERKKTRESTRVYALLSTLPSTKVEPQKLVQDRPTSLVSEDNQVQTANPNAEAEKGNGNSKWNNGRLAIQFRGLR